MESKTNNEMGSIPYDNSNNVENSLWGIQGRITRKDFFMRTFVCVLVWLAGHLLFVCWESPNYEGWVARGGGKIQAGAVQIEMRHKAARILDYYVIPSMLVGFMLIQAAKRLHDSNRSSKYLLVPFYNIALLFKEGDPRDNDYGLMPHREVKSPTYKKD